MKKLFSMLLFLLMLLLYNPTRTGTSEGLNIWLNNIVPVLFPYILIINIIMLFDAFTTFSVFVYPILSPVFKVSKNGCFCIITGFLCGFPIGIKLINDMTAKGKITPSEGNYLITFCNNISPSFYLNFIIGNNIMKNYAYINYSSVPLHILLILLPYLSSLICSLIYRTFNKGYIISLCNLTENSKHINHETNLPRSTNITCCILDTFQSIFIIGGYIIIFSIITNLIFYRINLPDFLSSIINTTIDISNSSVLFKNYSLKAMITILIPLCSFGGISALFQGLSFFKENGLSKRIFIIYRFLNFMVCFLLSNIIYFLFF